MSDEIPMARRNVIAERLAQGQSVVAAALAVEFGVSEDAVHPPLSQSLEHEVGNLLGHLRPSSLS